MVNGFKLVCRMNKTWFKLKEEMFGAEHNQITHSEEGIARCVYKTVRKLLFVMNRCLIRNRNKVKLGSDFRLPYILDYYKQLQQAKSIECLLCTENCF